MEFEVNFSSQCWSLWFHLAFGGLLCVWFCGFRVDVPVIQRVTMRVTPDAKEPRKALPKCIRLLRVINVGRGYLWPLDRHQHLGELLLGAATAGDAAAVPALNGICLISPP